MKKITLLFLLIFFVISCGKKTDLEYKAENNIMIVYN